MSFKFTDGRDGNSEIGLGHGRVDWNVEAVYFTEADQVVYMDDVRTILASLGSQIVIAPNRLNQEWCGLEPFRPGAFVDNSSVCNHRYVHYFKIMPGPMRSLLPYVPAFVPASLS